MLSNLTLEIFATQKTLYSTEGSSLCIRAMLYLIKSYALQNGQKPVIAAARNASGGTSAQRIMRLRQSQNLSRKTLSKALGIEQTRLENLEHGKSSLNLQELTAISEFFSVSTDFILKGADCNGK